MYCSSTENNKVNFFDGIRQKGCIMKLGKTQSTGAVQNVAKGIEVESCRRSEVELDISHLRLNQTN